MKGVKVHSWADGFGRWSAAVEFPHTLSESDPRPEFNLGHQWPGLRRRARAAIVAELAEREQKTWETYPEAQRRVRASLPRLEVRAQKLDAANRWHGVTFGEPDAF